jgi:hypothetical protein
MSLSTAHFVDVLFVCAKQEEAEAALQHLRADTSGIFRDAKQPEEVKVKSMLVTRFTLKSGYSAGLVAGIRQGPQSTGIFVATALMELRPLTTVMIGICAAMQRIKVRAQGHDGVPESRTFRLPYYFHLPRAFL